MSEEYKESRSRQAERLGSHLADMTLIEFNRTAASLHGTEAAMDFFYNTIIIAAEELGVAFGYGHLGDDPRAAARWILLGDEPAWPGVVTDGVPALMTGIRKAFNARYQDGNLDVNTAEPIVHPAPAKEYACGYGCGSEFHTAEEVNEHYRQKH